MRQLSDDEIVKLIVATGKEALEAGISLDELLKLTVSVESKGSPRNRYYINPIQKVTELIANYLKPEVQLMIERAGVSTVAEVKYNGVVLKPLTKVVEEINALPNTKAHQRVYYHGFNSSPYLDCPPDEEGIEI